MAKRSTSFALALPPRDPGVPAYRWLYAALRGGILAGRLPPGARLPGTRELAAQHGLARGTIVAAFEQLAAEGYVEGSVGSGTYVARTLPDDLLELARGARAGGGERRLPPARLSGYARRVRPFPGYELRRSHAFRPNLPAVDLFPTALWAQLAGRRLRRVSARDLLGCEPMGHRPLREAIVDYLAAARGVRCAVEQVAIVNGVQEALDLAARLVLDPGDRVGVEDPGYPGASLAFAAHGARVVPLALDDEGLALAPARLRGARLLYLTPAHQFPTGITMSLPRRLALLDWARGAGARIFEDDYDSEYRYSGRPVPAMQGLDESGRVLFAGTFSKVLFPALRLGYLVLPPDLVDACAATRSITARHPPMLEQTVLLDFIAGGHFGSHLRRMREIYAERLAALLAGAREHLAGRLELSPVEAGLQTSGRLLAGLDGEAAARAAAARGVEVVPLGRYARGPRTCEGLQLGFAAVDVREIRRGVRELAAALATRA
jgi:GntR family transcriptional regulator/MocR family aminotransferase